MNCQGVQESLTGLLDGDLSLPEHLDIEGHLADCNACRSELDGLRGTHELTARVLRASYAQSAKESSFTELWKAIEASQEDRAPAPRAVGQSRRPSSYDRRPGTRIAGRRSPWSRTAVRAVGAMAAAAGLALVLYSSRGSSLDGPLSQVAMAPGVRSDDAGHRGNSKGEPPAVARASGVRTHAVASAEGPVTTAGRQQLTADDLQVPDELRRRA